MRGWGAVMVTAPSLHGEENSGLRFDAPVALLLPVI